MGYKDTPYIINRIDNNGKRISDQNEKLRNVKICKELTKKHCLYIALGKENVKEHRLKEPDKTKYEIYHALQSTISKCRSWQELKTELHKSGITTELRNNGGTDKIQGVRVERMDMSSTVLKSTEHIVIPKSVTGCSKTSDCNRLRYTNLNNMSGRIAWNYLRSLKKRLQLWVEYSIY